MSYLLYKGIDHILAKHVAHLFIRDPVSLFEEKLNLDTENDSDHFEVCDKLLFHAAQFFAVFICLFLTEYPVY